MVGGEGGLPWQRYHLKTRFPNVQGLKSGAVVRLAGVEVGQVSDVEFAGMQVEVTMEISEDVQDKITEQSRIPDWGYIPSQKTPGQIAEVAEQASTGIVEATELLRDIRRGRGTVGKLFTDEQVYREFAQLTSALNAVVANLNQGEGTMGKLLKDDKAYQSLQASLDNLAGITRRINAGEGSLGRLLKDEEFARSLSSATTNFDKLTAGLERGEGSAGKLLKDEALYKRLDSVTARLDTLLTRLNDGEGTAGLLLRDKKLYENMNGAVSDVRALLVEIKKDPKKFLNVKVSIF
jgi:phospholipid/cholesterol/gamma-HCH transport system substrate-binding protein